MSLREAVRIALSELGVNRLRSALTMLGIIGVVAAILLVAIGNGVQTSVNEKVQPLANLITIVPTTGNVPGGAPKDLIDAGVAALQNQVPDAATVIPAITGQTLTETPKFRSHVVGSSQGWREVNTRDLQVGSFFDEGQVRSTARVVVLGPTVAESLFGDAAAALRQVIRTNHQTFTVIGLMKSIDEPCDSYVIMAAEHRALGAIMRTL